MQINLTDKKNQNTDPAGAQDSQTALMNISAGQNLPMVTPKKELTVIDKPKPNLAKVDELLSNVDLSKLEAEEREKVQERVEKVAKELEANPDFPKDKIQAVVTHLLDSALAGDLLVGETPEQAIQTAVPANDSAAQSGGDA